MLKVNGLDTGDPFSVVEHLKLLVMEVTWLYQSVKNDVAVKIDDGNSRQPLSFLGEDSLTVKRKNLCFSIKIG